MWTMRFGSTFLLSSSGPQMSLLLTGSEIDEMGLWEWKVWVTNVLLASKRRKRMVVGGCVPKRCPAFFLPRRRRSRMVYEVDGFMKKEKFLVIIAMTTWVSLLVASPRS